MGVGGYSGAGEGVTNRVPSVLCSMTSHPKVTNRVGVKRASQQSSSVILSATPVLFLWFIFVPVAFRKYATMLYSIRESHLLEPIQKSCKLIKYLVLCKSVINKLCITHVCV